MTAGDEATFMIPRVRMPRCTFLPFGDGPGLTETWTVAVELH